MRIRVSHVSIVHFVQINPVDAIRGQIAILNHTVDFVDLARGQYSLENPGVLGMWSSLYHSEGLVAPWDTRKFCTFRVLGIILGIVFFTLRGHLLV